MSESTNPIRLDSIEAIVEFNVMAIPDLQIKQDGTQVHLDQLG
jgi:hypothetical protein